jgi:antitoxin CptB
MDLRGSPEFKKLRWRCRRGMKELDALLSRYVDEDFLGACAAEQQAFEDLLGTQDPLIYAYCMRLERPPTPELAALIERITAATPAPRHYS